MTALALHRVEARKERDPTLTGGRDALDGQLGREAAGAVMV